MLRLLTSSLLVALTSASFCGDSAVPFSFEVLPDGQPVLGCARPTCFGWAPTGTPLSNTGAFYRINDHIDGYMSNVRESIPAFGPTDPRYYRPQMAICEAGFGSFNCAGANQWVGGVAPLLNVTAFPTMLQCCAFDALLLSEDRGVASLHGGQIVKGGEVIAASGLQVGFDYISDIAKIVNADGTIQYDVSVRRMPCAALPEDAAAAAKKTDGAAGALAFQEPNVPVDQPLPLPPQGPEGPVAPATPTGPQNGLLEELIEEEAVQLPAGTQFQPVPPPQQPVVFQQPQFIPPPQQFVPQPQFAAAQPVYNAPVAFGGAGGDAWCFTDDMTVQTMAGVKRMDALTKDDYVMAVSEETLEYVPVDFWLHRVPSQVAEFNEIETEDGKTIKLTDKHYIFKGDCSMVGAGWVPLELISQGAVTADQVHAGDCLYTIREDRRMQEVRVVRTGKVTQKGIYAPMTSTGRILVNGIHASCHNIFNTHSMGHSAFTWLDRAYDALIGREEIVETPSGLNTLLAVAEMVMPKNIITI